MYSTNHRTATDRHFETLKFNKKSELFFDGLLAELSAKAKDSYVLLWLGDEGQEQNTHWSTLAKDQWNTYGTTALSGQ